MSLFLVAGNRRGFAAGRTKAATFSPIQITVG